MNVQYWMPKCCWTSRRPLKKANRCWVAGVERSEPPENTTLWGRCAPPQPPTRFYQRPARSYAMATMTVAMLLIGLFTATRANAQDIELEAAEEAAFRAAVDRVAPAVVRIETIGGLQRVGKTRLGTGPTTGLVVDAQGHVITSAFHFAGRPSSILVRLPDGSRKAARLVATDHQRMLTLLKIEVDASTAGPLTSIMSVSEVVAVADMRVGQWAIAVGHTFESQRPNVAVGILSALGRIWGKAIQTDAAVSPNNYGGPLVDVHGRVLGVLVPLSPQATNEVAGVEWYDSGIGFAVDMQHVMKTLPRLKQGKDLHAGLLGVGFAGANPAVAEPVVSACHPKSPAAGVGIKSGDRIVEIDGQPIERLAGLKAALTAHYAGDKVQLVVLRDGNRQTHEVELVEKLSKVPAPETSKQEVEK